MTEGDLMKLIRVLEMLGSDHPGERAAAALAAHRHVRKRGTTWWNLLKPPAVEGKGVVIRTVYEWGIDHARAAESRLRQLRDENDRLRKALAKAKGGLGAPEAQGRRP